MIAHFLTGLLVGVLIGLAIAPILRSWILWQTVRAWDDRDDRADRPAMYGDDEP